MTFSLTPVTPSLMFKSTNRPAPLTPARSRPTQSTMMPSNDPLHVSTGRSASLAGKKRPRESDGDSKSTFRRTKSVDTSGTLGKSRTEKDRDRAAFQKSLINVFVPNALKESMSGTMNNYNDLVAHFQPSISSSSSQSAIPPFQPMLPFLRALTANVNLLTPDVHGSLVSAILDLPWATGDERFVKAFVGFAGVLISAQPAWAKEVVTAGVKGLAWQHPVNSTTSALISRRMYHARHHLLLSHLLSLVPTLSTVLLPLLIRHFPHRREPEVAQTTWVRNCCELIGYCSEITQRVWSEIVDRMLRIDLEITNILEEADDDEDDMDVEDEDEDNDDIKPSMSISMSLDPLDLGINQDVPPPEDALNVDSDDESEVDIDDLSSADGDNSEDEERATNEAKILADRERRRAAVKSMRTKLDGMLLYFFKHLEENMGGGNSAGVTAPELAANNLASNESNSGLSTPTNEIADQLGSVTATAARRASPTPAQSLSHFQTLLNLFTRQILPTSSAQHTPFLLFTTSALSPSHTDLFLGLLVSQALYATSTAAPNAHTQPVSMTQRIASTVYIGSIVCRARFVSDEQARQVLTYLLAYIDGKMHQTKPDELQLFYAVCQAVMLIFCFRWRAFQNEGLEGEGIVGDMEMEGESVEGDGKWISDLDILQRAITSDLNPLLGCNPTIVSTFAQVAHQTNFAYCFSIMEANQQTIGRQASQTTLPSSGSNTNIKSSGTTKSHPARQSSMSSSIASLSMPRAARQANIDSGLDAYFPFDPFTLARSKRFIDPLYRTWEEVAMDNQDSDDEDDVEDSDDDVKEDETSGLETGESLTSGGISVSPYDRRLTSSQGPLKASGSWKRRGLFERDHGLSSSLEGMSLSPNMKSLAGRR